MKFLIGYDIAGNRARSRVAKYLEGKAYRIQYSVFLFDGGGGGTRFLHGADVRGVLCANLEGGEDERGG